MFDFGFENVYCIIIDDTMRKGFFNLVEQSSSTNNMKNCKMIRNVGGKNATNIFTAATMMICEYIINQCCSTI